MSAPTVSEIKLVDALYQLVKERLIRDGYIRVGNATVEAMRSKEIRAEQFLDLLREVTEK